MTLPGYNHPKKEMYEEEYMCHRYSLKFKREQEAMKNAEKKMKQIKDEQEKKEILKQVFTTTTGSKFDTKIDTKN